MTDILIHNIKEVDTLEFINKQLHRTRKAVVKNMLRELKDLEPLRDYLRKHPDGTVAEAVKEFEDAKNKTSANKQKQRALR